MGTLGTNGFCCSQIIFLSSVKNTEFFVYPWLFLSLPLMTLISCAKLMWPRKFIIAWITNPQCLEILLSRGRRKHSSITFPILVPETTFLLVSTKIRITTWRDTILGTGKAAIFVFFANLSDLKGNPSHALLGLDPPRGCNSWYWPWPSSIL